MRHPVRVFSLLAVTLLFASVIVSGCGYPSVHAVPVMTGLDFPGAFTLDPDNHTIWYAERFTGEIRRRDLNNGQDTLVWTVPNLVTSGEQGLLGIALHPNYPSTQSLYAYASRNVGGLRNQILKITMTGGVGVSQTAIVDDPGIADNHNGGRIKFGPDGNLYAVIGEHQNPANSQIINANTNLAGKVLRLTPDGAVPADNPYPGSFVWASGIRNSYGFTFDTNQSLWLNDNGPSCNDEVDLITKAGNYSWGSEQTCSTPPAAPQNTNQSGPAPRLQPKLNYVGTLGITGAAFCNACGLNHNTRLLISGVNNGQIHSLGLDDARTSITSDQMIYDHQNGVLSIESRQGQPVYFSDSNAIYKLTFST